MANTYTQIHIQLVFAVSGRINFLIPERNAELHRYISGIFRHMEQKLLAIGGMGDHTHIFFGMRPDVRLSDLVQEVKTSSTHFLKTKGWFGGGSFWQHGYGAFSYSRSHVDVVVRYILGQEKHHRHHTFRDEYLALLRRFGIDYDERYLFDWEE